MKIYAVEDYEKWTGHLYSQNFFLNESKAKEYMKERKEWSHENTYMDLEIVEYDVIE